MAQGINISIASDTRDFASGVKRGVIEPLEDAGDSLDDLAKDGVKAGDKLERAMRDAQKETDDLADEHKKLSKVIEAESRKGSRAMERESKDGTSAVKRDLKEVGDEGRQNAAEMFSSFDGSFESIADAAQGTLGGVVGSLGPIGAIAGAAGAAGIGLLTAELVKQQEEADRLKEALTDAYRAAADEGRVYLDEAHIIGAATDIIFDPEKFENARQEAERIGIDVNTYIRGQAGSYADLTLVIEQGKKAVQERFDAFKDQSKQAVLFSDDEARAISGIIAENRVLLDIHDQNRTAIERTAQLREESEARQRTQIQRTRDADQARWEAHAEAVNRATAPREQEIKVKLTPDTTAIDNYLARPRNLQLDAIVTPRPGQKVP